MRQLRRPRQAKPGPDETGNPQTGETRLRYRATAKFRARLAISARGCFRGHRGRCVEPEDAGSVVHARTGWRTIRSPGARTSVWRSKASSADTFMQPGRQCPILPNCALRAVRVSRLRFGSKRSAYQHEVIIFRAPVVAADELAMQAEKSQSYLPVDAV